MAAKLITIPFSHYCEKARWALDRCGIAYDEEGHLPFLHYLATYRNGGGRTVPVLVDRTQTLRDSTDIITWADAKRPGALIPRTGAEESLAIEDDFDNHLGPATRVWGYFYLLPSRDAERAVVAGVPAWEKSMFQLARPLAVSYLQRGLQIDAAGCERSRTIIDETFARVSRMLRDGRRFLSGDRFTVADLAFAALAAPVLLPAEHPIQGPAMTIELFPSAAREQIEAWRTTPAGQLALRLYADERAVIAVPPPV